FAKFDGNSVLVIGQEKGGDTASRMKRNFGMAHPEGYRKAMRLMDIAEKFSLPVVSFVDTPGAYPGIEAEERGQAEAIARCLQRGLELETPFVAAVLGEGGSGGAVAIAAADKVLMFEHAVYSVISPEGCASILWRSAEHAPDAAEALKLTAADLSRLGVVDTVVKEPIGGAHRNPEVSIDALGNAIEVALRQIETDGVDGPTLRKRRRERFLAMGG
ncbi:MAG: carboxyltransferase subunit alpha, partial [Rhodospirillales bacterium]